MDGGRFIGDDREADARRIPHGNPSLLCTRALPARTRLFLFPIILRDACSAQRRAGAHVVQQRSARMAADKAVLQHRINHFIPAQTAPRRTVTERS